jgi:hypothetical protein
MPAQPARLPCFVPPTPPLQRGGGTRLLSLSDKANPHLHKALVGGADAAAVRATAHGLVQDGFAHLHLDLGHHLFRHLDGTVLLCQQRKDGTHGWFPVPLKVKTTPLGAPVPHVDGLQREALAWLAQPTPHVLGWAAHDLLPVHVSTPDPWRDLPTASLGGQMVLRAPHPRFQAFFGLAIAFLERNPTLVWDHLHFMMGMVGVRGQWVIQPKLTLAFSKRQGTFAAAAANKAWAKWSSAFMVEAICQRTLPAEHLAGWYWNTERHSGHLYRTPHSLTLAMDHAHNPFAQGKAYDLRTGASSHQRLALHAAFQRAAPDTYRLWMAA